MPIQFHPNPAILWLQDDQRVLLVDPKSGASCWLEGEAALLWAWLESGVTPSGCVKLLAALHAQEPGSAQRSLATSLSAWQADGWISGEAGA
jgi:hypothetical protein